MAVNDSLISPGHSACAGCGSIIALRKILEAAGKNTVVCLATGCMEITTTSYPMTAWNVPLVHVTFENAAAVASGVSHALKKQGKEDVNVIALGGDGGMADIGFQAISGALERNENILIICYDNEAYMNCLSSDSMILTEGGLKKITEVKKGEMVYSFDMESGSLILKKCAGVFNNGVKSVFEISTDSGSIKATGNHPFLVLKREGRGKESELVWKIAEDLRINDEVVSMKMGAEGESFAFKQVAISKKGDYKVNKINDVFLPKKSSDELMLLLGLYVGDGWTRADHAEVGFSLPEGCEGRKQVLKLSEKIFGAKIKRMNRNEVFIDSTNVVKFIDSLSFGKGAKNKTIPPWVFTLPLKEKMAFVKGLLLSDGYSIGNSNRYVSSSFGLLKNLRLLLQTMNYRVGKIHRQSKKKGDFVVYRPLLKDSEYGYVCFSQKEIFESKYESQSKYRNFLFKNDYFEMKKIRNITKLPPELTIDLSVEGSPNFIADGMVVHNTGVQRSGSSPLYADTTTSPAGKFSAGKTPWKKDLAKICAAHDIPYVATASIAYPNDLQAKVKKALSIKGSKFIQVNCPCPIGWKHESNKTIDIARLAVESGLLVLYELENGKKTVSVKPETLKPVKEYFSLQGRFKHLTDVQIAELQDLVTNKYNEFVK